LDGTSIFRRLKAAHPHIRAGSAEDADAIGDLLHAFNSEFDSPTPGAKAVAERVRELIQSGAATFLLVGSPPVGVAVLRFREAIFHDKLDAYLEEFYVAPDHRGRGLGRALLERALDTARERGAVRIDLGTAASDRAARHLYESFGFTNLEQQSDESTAMLFYELDL
jgi:ribosomal protein S18 acetylase RimI-like enzyme